MKRKTNNFYLHRTDLIRAGHSCWYLKHHKPNVLIQNFISLINS